MFFLHKNRDLLCRERDSNPHDLSGSRDFKSLVSTNSTIAAMVFADAKVRLFRETAKLFGEKHPCYAFLTLFDAVFCPNGVYINRNV